MKRAEFEDTTLDGKENISKVMNWVSLAHAEIVDSLSGSGRAPDDFDAEAMIRHYTRGDDEEIADCSQQ